MGSAVAALLVAQIVLGPYGSRGSGRFDSEAILSARSRIYGLKIYGNNRRTEGGCDRFRSKAIARVARCPRIEANGALSGG